MIKRLRANGRLIAFGAVGGVMIGALIGYFIPPAASFWLAGLLVVPLVVTAVWLGRRPLDESGR